ncbi:helix-turn-helix domain-containing protein [Streptomyces sp. NPDC002306]
MNHSSWRAARSQRLASVPDNEHEKDYEDASLAFTLGQMVYDRRAELGLTQTELATRAGMKQPAISRIEGGGTVPTVPLLRRLAKALDADLNISFTPREATFAVQAEPENVDGKELPENAVAPDEAADPQIAEALEHDEALFYALMSARLGLPVPTGGGVVTDRDMSAIHGAVEPFRELLQRNVRFRHSRPEGLGVWLVGAALLRTDEPAMRELIKSSQMVKALARESSELRAHQLHASLESLTKHFQSLAAELRVEAERLADA